MALLSLLLAHWPLAVAVLLVVAVVLYPALLANEVMRTGVFAALAALGLLHLWTARYEAGRSDARRDAERTALAQTATHWRDAAESYARLSERLADVAEKGDTRVREAADLAARRVADDVSAGRLRLRPVWQLPTAAALAADPGLAARAALDREGAAGRIVGVGARADARLATCVDLLKAERQ